MVSGGPVHDQVYESIGRDVRAGGLQPVMEGISSW